MVGLHWRSAVLDRCVCVCVCVCHDTLTVFHVLMAAKLRTHMHEHT